MTTSMTVINTGANPATFVLDASTVHGSKELTVTLEQDVVPRRRRDCGHFSSPRPRWFRFER